MKLENRLEKLESRLLPSRPWVSIYAPREGMAGEEKRAFIAAELAARGEPADSPVLFVTFVSVSTTRGRRVLGADGSEMAQIEGEQ